MYRSAFLYAYTFEFELIRRNYFILSILALTSLKTHHKAESMLKEQVHLPLQQRVIKRLNVVFYPFVDNSSYPQKGNVAMTQCQLVICALFNVED
ncbi:hypothetical protein DP923_08925 [Pontibacter arcticus]|uniref:Uncharacterized protein n=1 Tax=Pontibacter arcticus TaxID=2080288 RepID=A0A364RG53_9BACT|nr:hypothetical protein DP923_08925 [Pontibacter arcticus]